MTKSVFFALAFALAAASAPSAQAATSAEKAACRADAQELCSSHIGKPTEMRACLVSNKESLSEACRAVIEANGG